MRPLARGLAFVLFTFLSLAASAQFLTWRNHGTLPSNSNIGLFPANGSVYYAHANTHSIGRIDPETGATTVIAGGNGMGSQDGHVSVATFRYPSGVAVDSAGNIYVADDGNNKIRQISPDGTVITLAGSPGNVCGSSDGNTFSASFCGPRSIAIDPFGDLWIADAYNNRIRKMDMATGDVTTIAGSSAGSTNGTGTAARFNFPVSIAWNGTDGFYVADQNNSTIRKVTASGAVTTLAGLAGSLGNLDGTGSAARFYYPSGVWVAPDTGDVFVSDYYNYAVRRVTAAGVVTTPGGIVRGPGPEEGTGYSAQFDYPRAVAAFDSQTVFVADNGGIIKKGTRSIADEAKIDTAGGKTTIARQLSVAPLSATAFQWTVVNKPAASTATLSNASISNPTFTPDWEGSYRFRLDASSSAGTSITYVSLNATCQTPPPTPVITRISGTDPSCPGQPIVLEASAGYDTYTWRSGSTVYSTSPTLSAAPTSTTSWSLTVTLNGCSTSTSYTHNVTTQPSANPSIVQNSGGSTTVCSDGEGTTEGSYSLYPNSYSGAGYAKQWGYRTVAGGPITPIPGATNSTYVINGPDFPGTGTYRVVCTITPACGFSPVTSQEGFVTVRPAVNATLTSSAPSACGSSGTVTLTASGSGGTGGNYDIWIVQRSPQATVRLCTNVQTCTVAGQAGKSYYAVVWQNSTCSKTTTPDLAIGTYPLPTPQATSQYPNCEPARMVVVNPNPTSTYVWSNGATGTSMVPAVSDWYRVTETTAQGCSATSQYASVTQNMPPAATITASGPTTFCQGGSVTLTSALANAYLWSNGATTRSITVAHGGSYTVEITYGSNCKKTSAPTVVTVNDAPSATITADGPTNFCEGGSVVLSAPAGLSYLWSTGATTQSIVVNTSGSYTVTTTNAAGCSTTSTPALVTVSAPPSATIDVSGPATFCEGGSVTLTAPAGNSYLWSNGATTQSIVATQSGDYSVTVTNAGGCSASSTPVSVTVNPLPAGEIAASGPTTFCAGGSVSLTAPAAAAYLWSNGATTRSIDVNASGTFSVTVTSAEGCSRTTAAVAVNVGAYPAAGIHSTQIYDDGGSGTVVRNGDVIDACGNPTVRLVPLALNASYTYSWSNGATTAVLDVTTSGTYTVTVTAPQGCSTVSSVTVNYGAIPPKPAIEAAAGTELCPAGGSVTLTAPDADAWTWSNGATTRSIVVTEPGTFTVTVRNGACSSPQSDPIVITTGVSSITTEDSLTLCGTSGSATLTANDGTSWLWSTGATTRSIVVTEPGTYSVTTTNNGCTMPESAPVSVTRRTVAIEANGPTSFCSGGSVTLTASGGTSWLWSNGATTRSITVTTSGSYGVTASFGDGCAIDAAPVTVDARNVTATVVADRTTVCRNAPIQFTASASGGSGYTYQWYDQSYAPIAGATSSTLTIHPNSSGFVFVKVTDELGCIYNGNAVSYTVLPTPDATITTAAALCEGQNGSASVPVGPLGTSYEWTIAGGTLNFPNSSTVTFTPSGIDPVTLSVRVFNEGCEVTSSRTVTVNPLPVASITASGPTTFCQGGSVTLTASAAASYAWSNGATTQSIVVTQAGNYSVTVTNANGCSSTSPATTVTVNANPTATITASGPTTFCEGGSVTLTASAATSYAWSNGATTQSIVVNTSGSYTVTTTNANGCSTTSSATAVTVKPLPSTTISASGPTTFCQGGSVTLTAPDGYSYFWSTGTMAQSITVHQSGTFSVTLSSNGCSVTSAPITVTVNPLPTGPIAASGPTTFCEGGSVTLTAPAGASYAWSNGATTPSIVVTETGNHSVTVTSEAGCTWTSNPTSVTVYAKPVVNVSPSGTVTFCQGGSVNLVASSNGGSYLWSNGATTQSINVTTSGSYSVTVHNSATGCSTTSAPTTVVVKPTPEATVTASGPLTFCNGGSVTLTASPGGSAYSWNNGATTQSITVTSSGTYYVGVSNAEGCSKSSSFVNVTVLSKPTASITASGPTTFCEGGSVTLTANTVAGASYLWSNGATTQSIDATTSGSYTVTITSSNGCSTTSAPANVTVTPMPAPAITANGPTTFCQGGSVTLTGEGGNGMWVRDGSLGLTANSINVTSSGTYVYRITSGGCVANSSPVTVTVNALPSLTSGGGPATACWNSTSWYEIDNQPAGTTYAWTVTNATIVSGADASRVNYQPNAEATSVSLDVVVTNPAGCSSSRHFDVPVDRPLPTITAGGPTTFCPGGSVTLTAAAPPSGWTVFWSNNASGPSITVSAAGTYTARYSKLAGGCMSPASNPIAVTVHPAATASITPSGPTSFCEGGSVTLTANSGSSYLWSNGATTQSIVASASGSYSVTVTNANGCSATSSATNVTVNALPVATITPSGPTTFCNGAAVTLTASLGSSYLWSNGATTRSIDVNASGSYNVTVTNANGCSATSSATSVTVNTATPATITESGPTTFCAGGSVTLTASSGASYLWSNGATTQSIAATASGSYSVTVTDANGCSSTSASKSVAVNPLPAATITPSGATTFCEGGSVTLTASAGNAWLWSNGATTQSIDVTTGGSYAVTVTNANGCSSTSSPMTVTVQPKPVATITPSGPTTFCEGGSVTLTASAGSAWLWSNGATTQSIDVTVSGSYTVSVTGANGCAATSASTTVTVNPAPVPTITPSGATTFCSGGSLTLTASSAASYLWSNGATTRSIDVSSSGSYSVTTTYANGCSRTSAAATVTVVAPPPATITESGPLTFCAGGSVTLTAPAGYSYLWSNGATSPSINVTASGSYTVTVTNANNCSATSAPKVVNVLAAPPATITESGPLTFCTGGSVTLTAPAGYSYLWSNGATSQSINVNASGSYSVTVTNANNCSATSAPKVVTVNATPATPTINASGATTFCPGGSVTLTAPAGFASYLWSNGATSPSINVSASGNYTVTVTNASGCSATSAATAVTVRAATAISQHPQSKTISRNTTTTLTVTATATAPLTYQWYRGTSPSTATPVSGATTASYTTPKLNRGTYTYWVRVTGACGFVNSNTATITVP
jgi:large repetitive protein